MKNHYHVIVPYNRLTSPATENLCRDTCHSAIGLESISINQSINQSINTVENSNPQTNAKH